VELLREIGIVVGLRWRGQRDCHSDDSSEPHSLHNRDSAVSHGCVIRRVLGAIVGFLRRDDALVVEEDLRPVGPRQRHGIGEIRRHLFGVGPAIRGTQRVEVMRTVYGDLLNLGRLMCLSMMYRS
jgi:hypothetical protein